MTTARTADLERLAAYARFLRMPDAAESDPTFGALTRQLPFLLGCASLVGKHGPTIAFALGFQRGYATDEARLRELRTVLAALEALEEEPARERRFDPDPALCQCFCWAYDHPRSAIWAALEVRETLIPLGHHPTCRHYVMPPDCPEVTGMKPLVSAEFPAALVALARAYCEDKDKS